MNQIIEHHCEVTAGHTIIYNYVLLYKNELAGFSNLFKFAPISFAS